MRRTGSGTHSYPLAGGSRARRRLLMQQSISDDADLDSLDELDPESEFAVVADDHADDGVLVESDAEIQSVEEPSPIRVSLTPDLDDLRAITRLLEGTRPVTWVFTGDSVTHGARYTEGRRSFAEHFAERVRWELRRFVDVVINTGVAGDRSGGLLKHLDWRALRFQPDVVAIMIGLNDATLGRQGRETFRDNLQQIIRRIRDEGAVVLLATPNQIDFGKAAGHADLRAYVKIIRETARDLEVTCVDHWAHWKRSVTTGMELNDWLAGDGLHPGSRGHRELARLTFSKLGIYDESSPSCRP